MKYIAPLVVTLLLMGGLQASPITETYLFSTTTRQFVVPAGVTQVSFEVLGGRGHIGNAPSGIGPTPTTGGLVRGDLTVSEGQVLHIFTGGSSTNQSGGFGGGGQGGNVNAGGGGGLSGIYVGSFDWQVIAGGGGGYGEYQNGDGGFGANGSIGFNSVSTGSNGSGIISNGGGLGGGAAGGAGGIGTAQNGVTGGVGTTFLGGVAFSGGNGGQGGGGAGGGAGAGGGIAGGGGGSGSSATNGFLAGGGGGAGGSNYIDATNVNNAVIGSILERQNAYTVSGDQGMVRITYTPIPEPSTVSFLFVAGLFLWSRKRGCFGCSDRGRFESR